MANRITEDRWFRVAVRPQGAIGNYKTSDFQLTVKVTGSYDAMIAEVFEQLIEKGWESHHLVAHSSKRETL